jgi:hypothetical protein
MDAAAIHAAVQTVLVDVFGSLVLAAVVLALRYTVNLKGRE